MALLRPMGPCRWAVLSIGLASVALLALSGALLREATDLDSLVVAFVTWVGSGAVWAWVAVGSR